MARLVLVNEKSGGEPKVALRESVLALRQRFTPDEAQRAALTRNLCEVRDRLNTKVVATYLSFGTEPYTRDFISDCNDRGIVVLTPQTLPDRKLSWVQTNLHELERGSLGFEEALGESASLQDAQVIFAPALAVDQEGHRLGRGGGYFDIALAEKKLGQPVYGVVFQREFLKVGIPVEWHDVPVNGVVTESTIFEFGEKP